MQEATASHSRSQPTIFPLKVRLAGHTALQSADSPCNYRKGKARVRSCPQTAVPGGEVETQLSTYHVTKFA